MSPNTDDIAGELRAVAFVLRRLGALRRALSYDECLRVGELLRDCADAIDHGAGPVTLPAPQEPAPQSEQKSDCRFESTIQRPEPDPKPATDEVQVAVRSLGASRRPPARPARPRKVAAD